MTTARSALPANVRRWLDRSLPSETRIPKCIINTQEGEIHVRAKWMPFTAETVYERDPFTFVWRARLKMLPGMWVVAEDGQWVYWKGKIAIPQKTAGLQMWALTH